MRLAKLVFLAVLTRRHFLTGFLLKFFGDRVQVDPSKSICLPYVLVTGLFLFHVTVSVRHFA